MSGADDLDESRRHGVPLDPRHPHPPPHPHLSTVDEDRTLNNGWHPPNNDECPLQHQQQSPTPCHVPQHLQQQQTQPIMEKPPDRIHDSSLCRTAKDLDGELSGLQAAAAKTALLIHGKATRTSLDGEVVTTEEEDDDQYSHWIFHKHVGFSNLNETKSILHPPSTHYRNGHLNNLYRKQTAQATGKSEAHDVVDELEKSNLLKQLHSLRQQRQNLKQNTSPAICQNLNEWNLRLSSSQQAHRNALSTLEAVSAKRIWAEEEYQLACKWHVLGDVFFIWHRGPFGTINGFRLGKSATTMVGLVKKCAGGSSGGGGQGAGQGGSGGGASLFSWGGSENNGTANSHTHQTNNLNNGSSNGANPIATPEKVILPWNEINSALGQVVFLLYTLQNAPYSGISYRKHILQPCGSASKIGILKRQAPHAVHVQQPKNERRRITALAAYYNTGTPDGASKSPPSQPISKTSSQYSLPPPLPGEVTWYNLHHYEENGSLLSMGYYARRNFNTALEGLLHCIAEACYVVEKRDMALAAPYIMQVDGLVVGKDVHGIREGSIVGSGGTKDGEATVGGLPLAYDPATGEQWTMVCKYLLTNLKWLVAYAAKHVDR